MKNLDKIKANTAKERAEIFAAMNSEDKQVQEEAVNKFFNSIEKTVLAAAKEDINLVKNEMSDNNILVSRGTRRALTSKETSYFAAVIENESFENVTEVFPETILEDVIAGIGRDHTLLKHIDIKDTAALSKYVYSKPTKALAVWGDIDSSIKEMINEGFKIIDALAHKLSGFLPLPKSFSKLGPVWLATFVIESLYEIMSYGLEIAVISGNGNKQPIGMTKALTGAVDGVHKDKEVIPMKDLSPRSMGSVMAKFAESETINGEMLFIVNPVTYWKYVFAEFLVSDSNGNWLLDRTPIGAIIVQSYAVPIDKAIMGVGGNYFLGVAGKAQVTKYTETLAIEDMDLFIAKFFGYGQPKEDGCFEVLDLSKLNDVPENKPEEVEPGDKAVNEKEPPEEEPGEEKATTKKATK